MSSPNNIFRIVFYLNLKPLSLLPPGALFILSDILYWGMMATVPYRAKVVNQNLKLAYPLKTNKERKEIARKFYRHFCDLLAESIKLFSIKQSEAIRRFKVTNPDLLEHLALKGKSAILVGGHYQNWELFAVATAPQIKHTLLGIYTPLTNPFMEGKFAQSRSKFGLVLVPKKRTKSFFDTFKNQLTITTFAIDQCPRKDQKVYWTQFLGVETAVHFGAEKYAREYDYAVVYGSAVKTRRGYYELTLEVLEHNPRETKEGEITEKHTKKLEQQILAAPQYWLWTHKRWKLSKNTP
ncbi:MAG: lysophospholipid acyltransferase family protein [Marinoscillum sp.]